MSSSVPQVPPRPQRTAQQEQIPTIPPRPARKMERSVSPHRYARSPLNQAPSNSHGVYGTQSNLSRSSLHADSAESRLDLPPRPPSVNLPSLGQEGSEYGEVFTPELQPTHVANNLEIIAPKPNLPVSSAKKRVSAVTRTDSDTAAAHGIGRGRTDRGDDLDPSSRSLKSKTSQASITKERRPSSAHGDHGIPEIGQQVPMYPHAGDVQAPSPSPFAPIYAPGIGFHNDGTKPKHHARRTSARGDIPPDAYGRFGHNVPHEKDQFERAYHEKHPEVAAREIGHYGEGRPEWAMSSDDLNRSVRETASRGAGMGTKSSIYSIPTEEVGHQATEEYASRISSPRPQSSYGHSHANKSVSHVDSPLRKASFPSDGGNKAEIEGAISKSLGQSSEHAAESEAEDDDVIHVDHPGYRLSKVYSGASRHESQDDLRPHGVDESDHEDHGYSAPILAEDELAKEPFGYALQPAVSPVHQRGYYDDGGRHHRRTGSGSLSDSRPSSRPGSIHGGIPGLRVSDSTPLEDLQEYEPLFPEEEKAKQQKPLSQADRLKQRPDLKNRKFPSQDVWEDTPDSLQYTAEVSTPQEEEVSEEAKAQAKAELERNETPGQAFARRQEELAERESRNPDSFLHREQKNKASWPQNAPGSAASNRSMSKQRFPSRDIWEDTPDSLQLQTTVGAPQAEEDTLSPPDERPTTGALVFHQEKLAAGEDLGRDEGRATTGIAATLKPEIPSRPVRNQAPQSPEKTQPAIPERPSRVKATGDVNAPPVPVKTKPAVPARPSKRQDSVDGSPLTTVESNTSTKSTGSDHSAAAASKPKPPVPARPLGGKIAALQGGFLSDLNKRLQLGPQAPKKEEPVTEETEAVQEKAPLSDARKGRARGPARRAPAKSPAPATGSEAQANFTFSTPSSIWAIDPEQNDLHVFLSDPLATTKDALLKDAPLQTLGTSMAGDSVQDSPRAIPQQDKSAPLSQDTKAEAEEDTGKINLASNLDNDDLEPVKSSDIPLVNVKQDSSPTPHLAVDESEERPTIGAILAKSTSHTERVDIDDDTELVDESTSHSTSYSAAPDAQSSGVTPSQVETEKLVVPGAFDEEEEAAAANVGRA